MQDREAMRFVNLLARELDSGSVRLPSLPDVVVKIRKLLEEQTADFDQVARAVSADPVLASRLMVFANSSAYGTSAGGVNSIEAAISRLGFRTVRDTAISLAVRQLFLAEKHRAVAKQLRALWGRSMQLSSLAHAIADRHADVDAETAFLCGLMHDVGKLYILTKSKDFPDFLGDPESLSVILAEWHGKIGKSILEAWSFPAEICESIDPTEYINDHTHLAPTFADVMFVAERILAASVDGTPDFATMPSSVRLAIDDRAAGEILTAYKGKLLSVQEALQAA